MYVRKHFGVALLVFCSLFLGSTLFVITSLINRHGPPVQGGQYEGVGPYRHAIGLPFIYLERSLPDGVWQPQAQPPGYADSGHQLNIWYMVTDMAIWVVIAAILAALLYIVLKPSPGNYHSNE